MGRTYRSILSSFWEIEGQYSLISGLKQHMITMRGFFSTGKDVSVNTLIILRNRGTILADLWIKATHDNNEDYIYFLRMETILYLIEIGRTYLSNLRTHFALVFSSRRSIRWMRMNMAACVVVVAWGTLSTRVAWSTTTTAFGSVNGLRHHEAGLTGLTRSRRWGRGWWITAVPVEATRHLLTF